MFFGLSFTFLCSFIAFLHERQYLTLLGAESVERDWVAEKKIYAFEMSRHIDRYIFVKLH